LSIGFSKNSQLFYRRLSAGSGILSLLLRRWQDIDGHSTNQFSSGVSGLSATCRDRPCPGRHTHLRSHLLQYSGAAGQHPPRSRYWLISRWKRKFHGQWFRNNLTITRNGRSTPSSLGSFLHWEGVRRL